MEHAVAPEAIAGVIAFLVATAAAPVERCGTAGIRRLTTEREPRSVSIHAWRWRVRRYRVRRHAAKRTVRGGGRAEPAAPWPSSAGRAARDEGPDRRGRAQQRQNRAAAARSG